MEDSTAARGVQAQSADGVHTAGWDDPRGGGRAGSRLKPEIKVTIGGDRPPNLGDGVVTFGDMREFLVAIFGVRPADAYYKPKWKTPGAPEEAKAARLRDPNIGGTMASFGPTCPRRS